MRFAALAADYDGTLALAGIVAPATVAAVERLKDIGSSTKSAPQAALASTCSALTGRFSVLPCIA